mgnify:CR=1 FL=1
MSRIGTSDAVLELAGVTKVYPSHPPVTALRDVSLRIRAGDGRSRATFASTTR